MYLPLTDQVYHGITYGIIKLVGISGLSSIPHHLLYSNDSYLLAYMARLEFVKLFSLEEANGFHLIS